MSTLVNRLPAPITVVPATRSRPAGGRSRATSAAILLVEDDPALREELSASLTADGFEVRLAASGEEAVALAHDDWSPDLIVIDLLMPKLESYAICRALRSTFGVPLIVTAPGGSIQLDPGDADDILTRPFEWPELAARIRTVLNRERDAQDFVTAGPLVLLPEQGQAYLHGRRLTLAADEFTLLNRLALTPGQAVRRVDLLATLRGVDRDIDPRVIDVYLVRLMVRISREPGLRISHAADLDGYVLVTSGQGRRADPA